ncbi:hypothetical protein [Chitinimonas sp.]|uniref:hypothetical protein n=1 Tax=Chitinimonas sp. TaxID=1934313 RepID=UPI002F92D60A
MAGERYQLHFSSLLAASATEVAERQLTVAGVNYELGPWLRMRFPVSQWQQLRQLPRQQWLGRCWLLLLGWLPVDYDELRFEEIQTHGFVEQSRLLSQQSWRHERRIEALAGGCRLTDRVGFTPRRGVPGWLSRHIIHALFLWRHRQLRLRYSLLPHA